MIDLMFRSEYDVYVFHTAPTANARRLLGMSKVCPLWVDKMLKSREEARSLRKMPSFTKKEAKQEHLKTIWREFDDSVRAIVPLFETEVRGVPMLRRLSDAMFAADGKAASEPNEPIGHPRQAGARP